MGKLLRAQIKRDKVRQSEWYSLRPILGHASWGAVFYFLLGGREAGKSYAVLDFFLNQWVNKGIPYTWIRLTEKQSQKLLQNNAEKHIDPALRRRYNLDIITNGSNVYQVVKRSEPDKNGKTKVLEKKLMARILSLSTFYNDKGNGLFDQDFLKDLSMRYNICLDEFQKEQGEKAYCFDIVYAFTNQMENLVRSTKERMKIFLIGNTLEEAADLLTAFDFIPEQFGTYKLKKKRAVIEYIEPSDRYLQRRKGTLADILMPTASTFTNKIETDKTLITKQRLVSPQYIVKFSKRKDQWFTVWNNNIIAPYNGERKPVIAMRPYLDELYATDLMTNIVNLFDTRCFQFRNLITFKKFQQQVALLKPRNS